MLLLLLLLVDDDDDDVYATFLIRFRLHSTLATSYTRLILVALVLLYSLRVWLEVMGMSFWMMKFIVRESSPSKKICRNDLQMLSTMNYSVVVMARI